MEMWRSPGAKCSKAHLVDSLVQVVLELLPGIADVVSIEDVEAVGGGLVCLHIPPLAIAMATIRHSTSRDNRGWESYIWSLRTARHVVRSRPCCQQEMVLNAVTTVSTMSRWLDDLRDHFSIRGSRSCVSYHRWDVRTSSATSFAAPSALDAAFSTFFSPKPNRTYAAPLYQQAAPISHAAYCMFGNAYWKTKLERKQISRQ